MEILGERVDLDINILSRSIIIENFHKSLFSNSKCREIFSKFGYIKSISRKKSFVIIEYAANDQCHEAMTKANSMMFERQPLRVSLGSSHLNLAKSMESTQRTSICNSAPPYEIAIIVTSRELVSYAEKIKNEIKKIRAVNITRPPISHMMVLMSVDHLFPCIDDISSNGCLLAVIVNDVNYIRSSCSVRVLYTENPQEHRNMPLTDALLLISKQFDEYHLSKNSLRITESPVVTKEDSRSVKKTHSNSIDYRSKEEAVPPSAKVARSKDESSRHRSSSSHKDRSRSTSTTRSEDYHIEREPQKSNSPMPTPISSHTSNPDSVLTSSIPVEKSYDMDIDPRIQPPTKNQKAIMQMILDNRLVSVGELDEIASFIDMRRVKLGAKSQLNVNNASPVETTKSDSSELKNNILKMLYEPNAASATKQTAANQDYSDLMMENEKVQMKDVPLYSQYPNQGNLIGDSRKVKITPVPKPANSYELKVSPVKRQVNNHLGSSSNGTSSTLLRLSGMQNQEESNIYSNPNLNTLSSANHEQIQAPVLSTAASISSLNSALNNPVVKRAVDNLINVTNNPQSSSKPKPVAVHQQPPPINPVLPPVQKPMNHQQPPPPQNLRPPPPMPPSHFDTNSGYGNEYYRHPAQMQRPPNIIPPPGGHTRYPPMMGNPYGAPPTPYPPYYPSHHRNY